jgi:hypothetical protein
MQLCSELGKAGEVVRGEGRVSPAGKCGRVQVTRDVKKIQIPLA